jgi:very-short-patch-repair endonuclease
MGESPISIEVMVSGTINYATQQNDIPIIHSLRLKNTSEVDLKDLVVSITTEPNFAVKAERRIALLASGEEFNLGKIDLTLSHDFLFQLTERVVGTICINVTESGGSQSNKREKIALLAYDEWSGLNGIAEMIAAFVLPNHPAVETLLASAASLLQQWTGHSTLSGYQSKSRDRVALTAAAIYSSMQATGIRYINPPASFENSGQKIRTPDRVLENKLGTCLDLVVLTAACLEQAGLHPLIMFVEGHAFVGVWLEDECFPDCSTDDVLRLKKRVELGEICVFETTLLTTPSVVTFEQAVKEGKRRLDEIDSFRCVVDISRSRKSRIRPLPLRSNLQVSDAAVPTGKQQSLNLNLPDITSFLPTLNVEASTVPLVEAPSSRLDRWKRKLLDLTMNNRLLNFRDTKKTLPLLYSDLASLEDALADGEAFKLYPRPSDLEDSQERDMEVYRLRTGDDAFRDLIQEEFRAHRLRSNLTDTDLSRRLVDIYRGAKISIEENGANTLYLALGFLVWYESKNSSLRRMAPIILIPLEIERRSVQEGFSISQSDEEPMVNVTLLELLEHDFQLTVPGMDSIQHDEHGVDVCGILNAFRKAIKMIDRWEVLDTAYIGHFSFTKFLMWRDLEVRTEDLQKNSVVSHLIHNPNEVYDAGCELPDPDTLDDTHKPNEIFCPMEADSSQLAAVCSAAEGNSFVLHGPPGTGKSQTITNIIAHALGSGKSVLFVAEKIAALRVVRRRLEQSGLGDFCLELHSNKSHKKEVLSQLGDAIDRLSSNSSEDWLREATQLTSLRRELNSYVRALHQVRDTGESLFQGFSQLIGLRDFAPVSLGWPANKKMDRETLDRLRDTVSQLELAASTSIHPGLSVWAKAGCEGWGPGWLGDVKAALQQLNDSCNRLQQAAEAIAPMLGMGTGDWSAFDLDALKRISKALVDLPRISAAMMNSSDWETLSASITEWIEHGLHRDALRGELFSRYSEKILQLDLDELSKRLVEANKSWFLPRILGQRKVKRALSGVLQPGLQVDVTTMPHDLEVAHFLRDEEKSLAEVNDQAFNVLGQFWRGGEADWQIIAKMRDETSTLRKLAVQIAGIDTERVPHLMRKWAVLASEKHEQLAVGAPIGRLLQDYNDKAQSFFEARGVLESVVALDINSVWGCASSPGHLENIAFHVGEWKEHLGELRSWCHWRAVCHQAVDLGLNPIIEAYVSGGLPVDHIKKVFLRSFYQWWVDRLIDSEPRVRTFFSREFERKIEQFREVDRRYIELTRNEIQARLASKLPQNGQAANHNSETGILHRERLKQRRQMPIRQLFKKIPNLLPRLKPCLLMSPLSVAQYLDPAHPPFDLVVFDEASQIPVWDAVGAIARGKEAVIVGDPKQLPPTNFFARTDDAEESEDDVVEDMESILDDCLAARFPKMHLRWHYRSRHESLIAFSNYHYYENKLLTFPSPSRELGVSLRQVDGVYDKSKSRTNRAEAEAIVAEVLHRLLDPELSRYSIGIVTFSMSQQTLIDDLLDDARRMNPEIEVFFDGKTAPNNEPVFVKNLENVQGDERDAVLFSICYGPDSQGRVSMNFGPINRDGGERRLNVAITRARREVIVFSTLRPEQIDMSRVRARGMADLKSFLDYAARGAAALAEECITDPSAECESFFESQVCEALRNRGYTVHSQVGCSHYRIDLAVVDPEKPGRYLLGIECDGANYHRAKTARDRDRLRENVLKGLGWRLHRVWSTDWWEKPDDELARIEEAISEAKLALTKGKEQAQIASAPLPAVEKTELIREKPAQCNNISAKKPEFPSYEPFQISGIFGDLSAFYQPSADRLIKHVLEEIVNKESPIAMTLAARRVAAHWGIGKVGSGVSKRINHIVSSANIKYSKSNGRFFLWECGTNPSEYKLFRVPGKDEASKRSADELPPEEIANAGLHVLKNQISLPIDDLICETARVFGYARTGQKVALSMKSGIDLLVARGDASEQDGTIVLNCD